jgi:hypothetical protein
LDALRQLVLLVVLWILPTHLDVTLQEHRLFEEPMTGSLGNTAVELA